MQVTVNHPRYAELTVEAIDKRMLELGFFQTYNPNLVKDLANAASFQVWGEDKKDSFIDLQTLGLEPEELKYYTNVQTFLENINFSEFRGGSPLEKAVDVITMMNSQEGGDAKSDKSKKPQESKPNPKPQPKPNSQNQDKSDKGEEQEGNGNESEEEGQGQSKPSNQKSNQESNKPQQGKGNGKPSNEGEENGESQANPNEEGDVAQRADETAKYDFFNSNTSGTIQKTKIMQDGVQQYRKAVEAGIADAFHNPVEMPDWLKIQKLTPQDKKVLDNLNVVRNFGKLKAKKANPHKIGQMTEYAQVTQLSNITEMMMPSFKKKLASKELSVKKTEGGKKNAVVLLIDDSGSQSEASKQAFIKAIILHFLSETAKNNCELVLLWYETRVFWENMIHIKDKKQAQAFIKAGKYGSYNLGGTDLAACLLDVEDNITRGKLGDIRFSKIDKFKITLITDGCDYIDESVILKYDTNAFILGNENQNLQTVIERSKGLFKRFC